MVKTDCHCGFLNQISGEESTNERRNANKVYISELIKGFNHQVRISIVLSEMNSADITTKLAQIHENNTITDVCHPGNELKRLHNMHHFGVDRTLFLARKVDHHVTRDAVKCVVKR